MSLFFSGRGKCVHRTYLKFDPLSPLFRKSQMKVLVSYTGNPVGSLEQIDKQKLFIIDNMEQLRYTWPQRVKPQALRHTISIYQAHSPSRPNRDNRFGSGTERTFTKRASKRLQSMSPTGEHGRDRDAELTTGLAITHKSPEWYKHL